MWRDFRLVSVLLQQRTYHRNWFKLLQKRVLYKSYYDSWRTLVIKFHHSTCQTPEMRKIATHKFNILTLKNVTWRTYLISFTVQCCFLFRFVSIELVSLIWVLQIWVAIYIYGTIIFNKEINANVYRHYLWEYSKRFHCSFELHLTPHITLSVETCIRHPVLSGHYSGCPLIQVSLYVPSPLLEGGIGVY